MSKGKNTRQFIIEQTAPLFNTKGVAATAITDIMEVTNLAKGSLYVHFANKEELAYCAVDYNLQQFVEKTGAEAQKYSGAKEQFFALLDYLGDPLNPPVKGGCPMMNFGMEADDTNPVIKEKVYNTICTVQQAMTDIVEHGIAAGTFRKDWDVKVFVTKAYAMIEGGILVSRVSGNSDQMNLLVGLLKAEIEEQVIKS
ncbi:transcriptional regulator, TetR family [Chitinophaga sp. YR627]|uniref:TetR/AcrR family transcriptional regulator n=1 Tax=Chitinophaga sp. YR627 TaxID=1881041 RepID=UPI0008E9B370|nr:TetR/AcrR family transcriptional regulator [Chitinophaga sp. YR627]SFM81795.1 transcriptional regulator, TetR family [Chitinophaga sp. YR627]